MIMEVQVFFYLSTIFLKEIRSKAIASFFPSEVGFNSVCIKTEIITDISLEIKGKGQ